MSYREDLTDVTRQLRRLEDRMRRMETSRTVSLGDWVIELDGPSGAGQILRARNTITNVSTTLAVA